MSKTHQPRRGSDIENWIRRYRDEHLDSSGGRTGAWYALDGLLDDYTLHADTGAALTVPARQLGPHATSEEQ